MRFYLILKSLLSLKLFGKYSILFCNDLYLIESKGLHFNSHKGTQFSQIYNIFENMIIK